MRLSRRLTDLVKRHRTGVRWTLLAVLAAFIARFLSQNLKAISHVGAPDPTWFAGACAFALLSLFIQPFALKRLLEAHGRSVGYGTSLGLSTLPGLGKYVPGKVWSFLAGVYLFKTQGIPEQISATCLVLITSLNLVVAGVFSLAYCLPEHLTMTRLLPATAIGIILVLFISTRAFYPLLNRALRMAGRAEIRKGITGPALLQTLLILAIATLIYGLGFACLVRSLGAYRLRDVARVIGINAFGEATGFLAFFVPAGLGVREAIYVLGLTPLIGSGPAIVFSATARAWSTLIEFVGFACGWLGLR